MVCNTRRTNDLHTRIDELGVVWQHCDFFSIFQKKFLKKQFWKKCSRLKKGENIFFLNIFPKMFFENLFQSTSVRKMCKSVVRLLIYNIWDPFLLLIHGRFPEEPIPRVRSRVQFLFRKDISVTISLALRSYKLLLILPSIHLITL